MHRKIRHRISFFPFFFLEQSRLTLCKISFRNETCIKRKKKDLFEKNMKVVNKMYDKILYRILSYINIDIQGIATEMSIIDTRGT